MNWTSVFIIPGDHVKNGDERLVVLNRVAKSVVESMRGVHPTHVFAIVPPKGEARPVLKMYETAWKQARERAADKWAERQASQHRRDFGKFESMTSSTRSVGGCARPAYRSRIVRTYSATRVGGSRRTTLRLSLAT